jgi:HPr kinase/phosphorylase
VAVAACPDGEVLHASCVAVAGRGLLISGASGSGKSTLALDLMAFGAMLVADDRVCLQRAGTALLASAPPAIAGLIEARGIGLLRARAATAPVPVAALLDLDRVETDRLPEPRLIRLLGCDLPLLHRPSHAHFAAAVLQFLKAGRCGQ